MTHQVQTKRIKEMKRFVIIISSFIAFLVLCSKSCETPEDQNTGKEDAELKATLDSINSAFSADQILDESFRDQARQMLIDLFISDSITIFLNIIDEMFEKPISISDFLQNGTGSAGKISKFIFDSIALSEPLHRTNELNYSGILKFILTIEKSSSANSGLTLTVNKEVDIVATKVRKQFGSDTLQIWQVYLGDIR